MTTLQLDRLDQTMAETFHSRLLSYLKENNVIIAVDEDANIVSDDMNLHLMFNNYRREHDGTTRGLKLSKFGHSRMRKIFDSHEYEVTEPLTPRALVALDNNMTWPYYVDRSKIVFYSDVDASWFTLSGESLNTMTEILNG